MTEQERNHWMLDVIINIGVALIATFLIVRWVNTKFDEMNPKLDIIIMQQDQILQKLNEPGDGKQ